MFFDVLLMCFHVFGDVLRGLQRRFSCFLCLLRFRLALGIFFWGVFFKVVVGVLKVVLRVFTVLS